MDKKVMIVDDDEFIRLAIRELFESRGVEVVEAASASECLAQLEKGFWGVILMDIMMPEKDGWDAIKEIVDRNLYDGNVVAMLTAKDYPDQKMEGLKEYVIDYITKPYDNEEIVATVKGYLEIIGGPKG